MTDGLVRVRARKARKKEHGREGKGGREGVEGGMATYIGEEGGNSGYVETLNKSLSLVQSYIITGLHI